MGRTEARELFMQLLFQMEAQNNYSTEIKDKFLEAAQQADEEELNAHHSSQNNYINGLYEIIVSNIEGIDKRLSDYSDNWDISRINKVDFAICRLASAEMLYMDKIPISVSINEAVNMAKKFGTDESGKFVNGLLGNLAKNIEAIKEANE